MGNPKLKWTSEEEDALLNGIAKHGAGKWKNILTDPDFAPVFSKRTNIDLKDKWRNLTVSSNGHGVRDKSKIPKLKSLIASTSASALRPEPLPLAMVPHRQDAQIDIVMDDASSGTHEAKSTPKYNDIIFEAISTSTNPKGIDIHAIVAFIEKKMEVAPNFRRFLSSKLNRLVKQGKLEKLENNCYIIKRDRQPEQNEVKQPVPAAKEPKPPSSAPRETKSQQPQTNGCSSFDVAMDPASSNAVLLVADAEKKASIASEAVKETDRVMRMAEEAECFLQIANEIHERCLQGQIVLLAGQVD